MIVCFLGKAVIFLHLRSPLTLASVNHRCWLDLAILQIFLYLGSRSSDPFILCRFFFDKCPRFTDLEILRPVKPAEELD